MIISHKHRYLFVEVPHTGSHSIADQLIDNYGGQPILKKHANVTQFLAKASPEERQYFKFATVRNPLDSATTDFSKLKGNHKQQYTNPTFRMSNGGYITEQHVREFEFIRQNDADFPAFFSMFRNKIYNNWFLVGDRHFDLVIRFESLQQGFSDVLERLELPQLEPLGHANPTGAKRRHFTDFYTPNLYDQVARCYGPFMKKWGYDFPPHWGKIEVPLLSELQFRLLDRSVGTLARRFNLDPDAQLIHAGKRTVDMVTGARKRRLHT